MESDSNSNPRPGLEFRPPTRTVPSAPPSILKQIGVERVEEENEIGDCGERGGEEE